MSAQIDAIQSIFDHTWNGQFESLHAALTDVTPEESTWQASCYAKVAREPNWPLPGTVHFHVAHLAHCNEFYRRMIEARRTDDKPDVPERTGQDYESDLTRLEEIHQQLRELITNLSDEDLDASTPDGQNVRDYVSLAIRHDLWHAGQIIVARRLFASRKER